MPVQHDNTAPVISKFRSIGASKLANPRQAVFTVDHDVQNKSPANLRKYANIEKFAHEQGVDFYPPGRGIGVSRLRGRSPLGADNSAASNHDRRGIRVSRWSDGWCVRRATRSGPPIN